MYIHSMELEKCQVCLCPPLFLILKDMTEYVMGCIIMFEEFIRLLGWVGNFWWSYAINPVITCVFLQKKVNAYLGRIFLGLSSFCLFEIIFQSSKGFAIPFFIDLQQTKGPSIVKGVLTKKNLTCQCQNLSWVILAWLS